MNVLNRKERDELRQLRATVGENLHRYRRKRRMTLEKCARKAGMNPQAIDFYEMGKGEISLSVMAKLARALHVPLTALVAKQDEIG